jgi:hypothetical protein
MWSLRTVLNDVPNADPAEPTGAGRRSVRGRAAFVDDEACAAHKRQAIERLLSIDGDCTEVGGR